MFIMSEKTKIPGLLINDAFAPVEVDGALQSPDLHKMAQNYDHFQGEMWHEFLEQPEDSIEERKKAKRLATYYFIRTADKLHDVPGDRRLWIDRFNEFAIEKYGDVDSEKALGIMASDLAEWSGLETATRASGLYNKLASAEHAVDFRSSPEMKALEGLREPLLAYLPEITSTISQLEEKAYEMAEARPIFDGIFRELEKKDKDWEGWHTTNKPGKKNASTNVRGKAMDLPDGRGPFEDKRAFMYTEFHETGVHALRGVNGAKISEELSLGLPDSYEFDEGLGVAIGYIASGKLSYAMQDRYVDIALASGKFDGLRLSRDELIELDMSRTETRALVAGKPLPDPAKAKITSANNIDRIFRGGDAVPVYEGGKIVDQAVNTINSQYFDGFTLASSYIAQKVREGVSPKDLFDFLLCGGHDPTNPDHIQYLKDHGIKVI